MREDFKGLGFTPALTSGNQHKYLHMQKAGTFDTVITKQGYRIFTFATTRSSLNQKSILSRFFFTCLVDFDALSFVFSVFCCSSCERHEYKKSVIYNYKFCIAVSQSKSSFSFWKGNCYN